MLSPARKSRFQSMKKIYAVILCLLLPVLMGSAASALSEDTARQEELTVTVPLLQNGDLSEEETGVSGGNKEQDSRLAKAEAAVRTCLANLTETLDMQEFGLTQEELKDIFGSILNSTPSFFYVGNTYKIKLSAGKIVSFTPAYLYTAEEVTRLSAVYEQKVNEIVALVDPEMTDLQKLLFLNDYFCLEFQYDNTHTVYDALRFFTEKTGVCQSYTLAFIAVLEKLDIPVTYAQSTAMNHIWNIVQLDGKWYHVDLTWNDPLSDRFGRALHENFLLSDSGIAQTGHTGWTTPGNVVCTDTGYDRYFWKTIKTPFAAVKGGTYYIEDGVIYRVDLKTQEKETVLTVPDKWQVQDKPGYYYGTSYSCLAGYDGCLFYTTPSAVYRYRLSAGTSELYYAPDLSTGAIFSFYAVGERAVYLAANSPEYQTTLLGTGVLQLTGELETPSTVMLTGSDSYTYFCSNTAQALAKITDSDLSYVLTVYMQDGFFALYNMEALPAASSITFRGNGSTEFIIPNGITLQSTLHLSGTRFVMQKDSAFSLGKHMLTYTAPSPVLNIKITGGDASSLVILSSDGGQGVISAPVTVGTFVPDKSVRLTAAVSAGTVRVNEDVTLMLGADFGCTAVSGTGSLLLSPEKTGDGVYAGISIAGAVSVPVTVTFPADRAMNDPVLYAPKADASFISFRLQSDRYATDITPLFECRGDGRYLLTRESYLRIEDGVLYSFVSVLPQKRVVVPDGVTGIANYAFATAPEAERVFLPAGITEVGAFGIGYSFNSDGKLNVSDKTVYEVEQGSVCETYAINNGLLYESWFDGQFGSFLLRAYPTLGTVCLLSYTGEGADAVIPSVVTLSGVPYTEILYGDALFTGRTALTVYCPVLREQIPAETVQKWEKENTLYCGGEWFTVTFTASGVVYFTYPALKDSEVKLPESPPRSAIPDTAQYSYVFEAWSGYTQGMSVKENLTFSAVFAAQVRRYTYVFYAEDGITVLKQETEEYGVTVIPPEAPVKPPLEDGTEFLFAGWSSYAEGMILSKDMAFYAKYTVKGSIPTEITTLYYKIDQAFGYIRKIDADTDGAIFVSYFNDSDRLQITDESDRAVASSSYIGTGMKLSLMVDGETVQTLTMVVTGDLNGDGTVSLSDFVLIKAYLLGVRPLSGAYMEAADMNGDGTVTLIDFVQIKSYLLGIGAIEPN